MDPIAIIAIQRRGYKKRVKRLWVHPLICSRRYDGEHLKLLKMYSDYPELFQQYTRLTPKQFDYVLELVTPFIRKTKLNFRETISPTLRLFVTLRYLATGDLIRSIATSFCMGISTVREIIHETTHAIWLSLGKEFVKAPSSPSEWNKIANGFYEKWQFPNCVGAVDGKHVVISAPPKSGSQFFNYKGTFSVVLMATCDADYRFTTIDVGAYGRQSDGGIFASSGLGKLLNSGKADIGGPQKLPNSSTTLPMTFVGDEAFPLKCNMMRPYPGKDLTPEKRIFNYRLSRARRTIENAFGIMSMRFRIFRKSIHSSPERVSNIIKASVALHNYLRTEEIRNDDAHVSPFNFSAEIGEYDPSSLIEIQKLSTNTHSRAAKDMRDILAKYFQHEGAVPWQYESVGLTRNSLQGL